MTTRPRSSGSETVRRAGGEPRSQILDIATVRASAEVRRAPELGPGARVTTMTRLGWVDGEVASLGTTSLGAEFVPGLADALSSDGSLFHVLRDHYGLRPELLWSDAQLDTVPADVAAELGFEGRPPAWALRSCNRGADLGRTIELSHPWLRADVIRVVFELGRSGRSAEVGP